jgi:ATP-dependent exoDNAse (exonuclease V) alpha subunit
VLADITASGQIPTVRLTEIFRQAATCQIIVNAHKINQGQVPAAEKAGEASDFYDRMVDLPWQSTNNRSPKAVMFRNMLGLFGSTGSAIEFAGMLYESYTIILWP